MARTSESSMRHWFAKSSLNWRRQAYSRRRARAESTDGLDFLKSLSMTPIAKQLLRRIKDRQAQAGVVGLGYVGLPLAVEFARNGLTCTGIDVDARKVAAIARGESYIPDV